MSTFLPEMTLFDPQGRRLYLDAREREAFLVAALEENPQNRVFCHLVHYTGCRPSEALELTPTRILINEQAIVFRTLKKRKFDKNGNQRKPHYRSVPVPDRLIKRQSYDVYIGRPSKWGNPFAIGKDGTRKEVIAKYEAWVKTQPHLMAALPELKGKVLGCWCSPKACHGDVLDRLANSELGELEKQLNDTRDRIKEIEKKALRRLREGDDDGPEAA